MSIAARKINATSPVDRLGILRAQIAELETKERVLVDEIKSWGAGAYDAELYSATVAEIPGRESVDPKAMHDKLVELGVDGRWFNKHTKVSKASVRLTVTDR